jgi:hypothetical protein
VAYNRLRVYGIWQSEKETGPQSFIKTNELVGPHGVIKLDLKGLRQEHQLNVFEKIEHTMI